MYIILSNILHSFLIADVGNEYNLPDAAGTQLDS